MGRRVSTQREGAAVSVEARGERTGPLRVRSEPQVRCARSANSRRPRGTATIGDLRQAKAEALVARVDRPLASSLWILNHEQTDVGQSELARVNDLDSDDLASTPEPGQGRPPGVDGGDEVRDHDRKATPPQDVSEAVDGATEIDLSSER